MRDAENIINSTCLQIKPNICQNLNPESDKEKSKNINQKAIIAEREFEKSPKQEKIEEECDILTVKCDQVLIEQSEKQEVQTLGNWSYSSKETSKISETNELTIYANDTKKNQDLSKIPNKQFENLEDQMKCKSSTDRESESESSPKLVKNEIQPNKLPKADYSVSKDFSECYETKIVEKPINIDQNISSESEIKEIVIEATNAKKEQIFCENSTEQSKEDECQMEGGTVNDSEFECEKSPELVIIESKCEKSPEIDFSVSKDLLEIEKTETEKKSDNSDKNLRHASDIESPKIEICQIETKISSENQSNETKSEPIYKDNTSAPNSNQKCYSVTPTDLKTEITKTSAKNEMSEIKKLVKEQIKIIVDQNSGESGSEKSLKCDYSPISRSYEKTPELTNLNNNSDESVPKKQPEKPYTVQNKRKAEPYEPTSEPDFGPEQSKSQTSSAESTKQTANQNFCAPVAKTDSNAFDKLKNSKKRNKLLEELLEFEDVSDNSADFGAEKQNSSDFGYQKSKSPSSAIEKPNSLILGLKEQNLSSVEIEKPNSSDFETEKPNFLGPANSSGSKQEPMSVNSPESNETKKVSTDHYYSEERDYLEANTNVQTSPASDELKENSLPTPKFAKLSQKSEKAMLEEVQTNNSGNLKLLAESEPSQSETEAENSDTEVKDNQHTPPPTEGKKFASVSDIDYDCFPLLARDALAAQTREFSEAELARIAKKDRATMLSSFGRPRRVGLSRAIKVLPLLKKSCALHRED